MRQPSPAATPQRLSAARRTGALALAIALTASGARVSLAQEADAIAPSRADAEPGAAYSLGTFTDWSVRCIRGDDPATDPCQMSQRLLSSDGSPTAEVNIFTVPDNPQAVAGATFITPLETLLTRGIRLTIDGGEPRDYSFQFCNRGGCIAQVGLQGDTLADMRAGSGAVVRIFSVAAPNTPVDLEMSLAGFTAAYDSLAPIPGLE